MTDSIYKFIRDTPLYTPVRVELPPLVKDLWPMRILLPCPECGDERPFASTSGKENAFPILDYPLQVFRAQCTMCGWSDFVLWALVDLENKSLRKVGQFPPPELHGTKAVERALGSDVTLYRRALLCLSQGYGLGACAYFRRLLEHQIDPILRLMETALGAEGAEPKTLSDVKKALGSKSFSDKTEIAYRVAPRSLVVDGQNPLKLLHDELSIGVHRLSEEEATRAASECKAALEFVLSTLPARDAARTAFAEQIKQLASRRSKERGTSTDAP